MGKKRNKRKTEGEINELGKEYAILRDEPGDDEEVSKRRSKRREEIRGEIRAWIGFHLSQGKRQYSGDFENNTQGWVYFPPFDRAMARASRNRPSKKQLLTLQNVALGKHYEKVLVDSLSIAEMMEKVLAVYDPKHENGATFLSYFYLLLCYEQKGSLEKRVRTEWVPLESRDRRLYERCLECLEDPDDKAEVEETWQFPVLKKRNTPHVCIKKNGEYEIYIPAQVDIPDDAEDADDEGGAGRPSLEERFGFVEWLRGRGFGNPETFDNCHRERFENLWAEYLGRSLKYFYVKDAKAKASGTAQWIADFYRATLFDEARERHEPAQVPENAALMPRRFNFASLRTLYTFDVICVCHVKTGLRNDNPQLAESHWHTDRAWTDEPERMDRLCCMLRGMTPKGMANEAAARWAPQTRECLCGFEAVVDKGLVDLLLLDTERPTRPFLADVNPSVSVQGEEISLEPCDFQLEILFANTRRILRECLAVRSDKTLYDRRNDYREIRHVLFKGFAKNDEAPIAYIFRY